MINEQTVCETMKDTSMNVIFTRDFTKGDIVDLCTALGDGFKPLARMDGFIWDGERRLVRFRYQCGKYAGWPKVTDTSMEEWKDNSDVVFVKDTLGYFDLEAVFKQYTANGGPLYSKGWKKNEIDTLIKHLTDLGIMRTRKWKLSARRQIEWWKAVKERKCPSFIQHGKKSGVKLHENSVTRTTVSDGVAQM